MSSPPIKTHRSLETLHWQIRLGISGQALPLIGGSASLISFSDAPLPDVVFHSRTTSKLKSPFFRVCIGFTFIKRPGGFWRYCQSPFLETNPIPGIRTTMTLGPTSGFALSSVCHQTQTGGRSFIIVVKALEHGVRIWSHHTNIGMHIKHKVYFSIHCIPATFQRPGQHWFLTNQTALRKRVLHDLMTRSALMFGRSLDRKLRHVQISLALERDLTPENFSPSHLSFLSSPSSAQRALLRRAPRCQAADH